MKCALIGVSQQAATSPTEQIDVVGGSNGAEGAVRPIPSRIELSKNFSIISMEDIPLAIQNEELATAQDYP